MRVESHIHENVKVKNELTSVFESENTKIFSQSQKDAIEFFDATTSFQNGRYEVKLPFKEETDVNISDNYSVRNIRLKNVSNNTFKNRPDLLTEYDYIIIEQAKFDIIEPALGY